MDNGLSDEQKPIDGKDEAEDASKESVGSKCLMMARCGCSWRMVATTSDEERGETKEEEFPMVAAI